jgi:hypothetical protein
MEHCYIVDLMRVLPTVQIWCVVPLLVEVLFAGLHCICEYVQQGNEDQIQLCSWEYPHKEECTIVALAPEKRDIDAKITNRDRLDDEKIDTLRTMSFFLESLCGPLELGLALALIGWEFDCDCASHFVLCSAYLQFYH